MNAWDKLIYHCQRTSPDNAEVTTFGTPIARHINYQPLTGYTNVLQHGENVTRTYGAIIDFRQFKGLFNEGDLIYLCGKDYQDGNPPVIDENYVNGKGANAIVKSVRNQNLKIEMVIEKLI